MKKIGELAVIADRIGDRSYNDRKIGSSGIICLTVGSKTQVIPALIAPTELGPNQLSSVVEWRFFLIIHLRTDGHLDVFYKTILGKLLDKSTDNTDHSIFFP